MCGSCLPSRGKERIPFPTKFSSVLLSLVPFGVTFLVEGWLFPRHSLGGRRLTTELLQNGSLLLGGFRVKLQLEDPAAGGSSFLPFLRCLNDRGGWFECDTCLLVIFRALFPFKKTNYFTAWACMKLFIIVPGKEIPSIISVFTAYCQKMVKVVLTLFPTKPSCGQLT